MEGLNSMRVRILYSKITSVLYESNGNEEVGALIRCWWKCKIVQRLWETGCSLKMSNIKLPCAVLSRSVMSNSITHELWPSRLLCPWDSPGKNTGVSCHFFLQGIFLTQGSNSALQGLLHCRQIVYQLSYEVGISILLQMSM